MVLSRRTISLVLAIVLALAMWWIQEGGLDSSGGDRARDTSTSQLRDNGGEVDPESGLPVVDAAELPPEAARTLALIDAGGPFPYDEDDETFGNFEGILPDHDRGYYREYTVETPGLSHRGARRIVTGSSGEYYWTQDHYRSFERIAR